MNESTSTLPVPMKARQSRTLTEQIRAFTASAYERLPAEYLQAFRNLIQSLATDHVGSSAPDVGSRFPDFALEDDRGGIVTGRERWGSRVVVVKFYRGGWCPYCQLELAALERQRPELQSLNVELLAIAPEKPRFQRATRDATQATFTFLWDEHNALANSLGLSFPIDAAVRDVYRKLDLDLDEVNGEWVLPVPATFVVASGIVLYRFLDVDYMRRQDPMELLAVLRAIRRPSIAGQ